MQFTDEQIIAAIDSAPEMVRETLRSADTSKVVAAIGTAHRLHLDQIGSLAQINRNLLIGLVDPSEMYGELVGIGVSPDEARLIMSEINQRIFVPLREAMRTGSAPEVKKEQPAPVKQPASPVVPTVVQHHPVTPSAVPSTAMAPSIQSPQPTQVFTSAVGWPGAPVGNWQPAAAVHVYVPGPAPMQAQPYPQQVIGPEHPTYAPAPAETHSAATPHAESNPAPVVRTVRPVPEPPANLPGSNSTAPLEKEYVADPYREPM